MVGGVTASWSDQLLSHRWFGRWRAGRLRSSARYRIGRENVTLCSLSEIASYGEKLLLIIVIVP